METKSVIIKKNSKIIGCEIEFTTSPPWRLRIFDEINNEFEYSCEASDLFECLTELRVQYLEKENYIILCNGSRIDVYPSRMSRQMSGGRKAYITYLGKPARMTDLVDIFDPVSDENLSSIATVAVQLEYNRKWLQSLRAV